MFRKLGFAFCSITATAFLFTVASASAQVAGLPSRALITQNIDEGQLVTVRGNTRPEANATNDRGAVPDDLPMEHILLQLRRPPEQEQALQRFIDQLHTEGSPNFHQWITAQEFGQRFGLAKQDLDTITGWLGSHGFTVNTVYPSGIVIDFSGTAGMVRRAFHTEIHNLDVKGEKHIANISDPQIPAALAPAVLGIVSLHDFKPRQLHQMRKARPNYTFGDSLGSTYAVVPSDLATIYNLNPLFSSGYSGQGQTIVLIEDTDVFSTSDWTTFRSTLGLSGYTSGSFTTVHPAPSGGSNNCSDPGVIAPNDAEAILDAEWASAAAPNAALDLASCADTSTTFGGLIAIQNLLNASGQPPAIMSISYGECETQNGASANSAYSAAYQQAVTEGVSVFVAAGDSGAAGCDNSAAEATHGIGVSAFASTPYNVAVGGTDFSDTYSNTNSIYWNSTNTSSYGSALSYIPEIPWNDSCSGALLSNYLGYTVTYGADSSCNSTLGGFFLTTVAGGGGPSGCATGTPSLSGVVSGTCQGWSKPSWQSVFGNPNDGVRDTPDVSLFAADGLWSHYYVFCWSDTKKGGAACTGAPSGWSGAGGTSFASPIMAGIQALVNQKSGGRQGNPNPVYYQLAASEYGLSGSSCNSSNGNGVAGTCIFYDVTEGDADVDCTGTNSCYLPSGTDGVLSTVDSSYLPAYGTMTGWDFATGIGSVNATNLVNNWPTTSNPAVLSITKTHTGNFAQGQQHATYTVTVSNGASAGPTNRTVTVGETQPAGLSLVSMTGTGWSCTTNSCTRSDILNGGASYSAITVTVNVAANASTPQVNQVSVSGGGAPTASATDSTTIIATPAAPTGLSATAGNAQVSLSWNSSIGATSYNVQRSRVNGGPYTAIVTGLTAASYSDTGLINGTTYYYVAQSVNSAGTSPNSNQASATPSGSVTWSNGYSYRRAITIDHTKVPNTDQSNFPALISGMYPYLTATGNGGNVTSANGYDIIFTSDAAGTSPLAYERETYNASTGAVNFWVKIPTVSHSSDTVFYMFYGNSSITTDPSNGTVVWDSNYRGVWHLPNGTTLSANDSTSNSNNGVNNGALATAGQIGGAGSFNGTNQFIDLSTSGTLQPSGALTASAWIKASPAQTGYPQVVSDGDATGITGYNLFVQNGTGQGVAAFIVNVGGWGTCYSYGTTNLKDNSWHYIAGTYTGAGGTIDIYVDHVLEASTSCPNLSTNYGTSSRGEIGWKLDHGGNDDFNGVIDEARVSASVRSADWITTEYNNQSNPSTFYGIGTAINGAGSPAPSITSLSPTSGAAGTLVTITGTAFGLPQGSTVTFNGTTATPSTWSDTSIVVVTPFGATTGDVVVAVSGISSNGLSFTVTTSSWSNGYSYRRAITIDHTKVPNTDQSNFPALISGTYPYLVTTSKGGNVTSANGYDIIFTSDAAGASPLAYERETYNASSGAVNFWVNIPTVSHSSDTVVYIFYGNSSVTSDPSNGTKVWDSHYKGVWHLPNGTVLSAIDSTSNGNNGTNNGALATAGQIDGAGSFNGTNQDVDLSTSGTLQPSGAITASAWIKASSAQTGYPQVVSNGDATGITGYNLFVQNGTGQGVAAFIVNVGGWGTCYSFGTTDLRDNAWHYIAGTYTGAGGTINVYVDHVLEASTSCPNLSTNYGTSPRGEIGWKLDHGSNDDFNGVIDEVRVSAAVRSAGWITTEYNNQSSPSAFYGLGAASSGP